MTTEVAVKKIDHFVITTAHLEQCLSFYEQLGFRVDDGEGRYALLAGDFKINVHIRGHELAPHARHVQPGSADFCFEVGGDISSLRARLVKAGMNVISEVVARHGIRGKMCSFYLNDPDGNLVELSCYG